MASEKEYLTYVLEQLSGAEAVTWRPMMGEYLLYCRGKLFGGIYDNRFLVKNTKAARERMPEAPLVSPYPGAKPMLQPEDIDDREFLCELVNAMADE